MNEISALLNGPQGAFPPLRPVRAQPGEGCLCAGKPALAAHWLLCLELGLPVSTAVTNAFLLFQPPNVCIFVTAA